MSAAQQEAYVTKLILTMLCSFLLVWGPYAICAILVVFGKAQSISSPFSVLPLLFTKASVVLNALLYISLNESVSNHLLVNERRAYDVRVFRDYL